MTSFPLDPLASPAGSPRPGDRSGPLGLRVERVATDTALDGPGRLDGALHLDGGWLIPGAPRTVTITGTIGGKAVAAEAPAG